MNFPKTVIDLEALLYALTQQTEPLPAPLQHSLQDLEPALQKGQPEAAQQLREQIKTYPPLEAAYKATLEQWDAQYASQQRTKSLSATFQGTSGLDWLLVYQVMPTSDWVTTAKRLAQQQTQANKSGFWDKTDRIAVMLAGGVALGSAIAQLPGAVVGGVLAAAYGWYIGFAKPKSVRNS